MVSRIMVEIGIVTGCGLVPILTGTPPWSTRGEDIMPISSKFDTLDFSYLITFLVGGTRDLNLSFPHLKSIRPPLSSNSRAFKSRKTRQSGVVTHALHLISRVFLKKQNKIRRVGRLQAVQAKNSSNCSSTYYIL